jgi:multimeric flavodoxin WrbA
MGKRVVAIVGSYRRRGTVDTAVAAVLEGARLRGAETHTIYLTEQHLKFCTNCRTCVQTPGPKRGKCPLDDDLEGIVREIEAADAIVLGSPVNCGNVTAIFRQFMERMMGCCYWPWGEPAPKPRTRERRLKAVLVASSAMPSFMMALFTGAANALQMTATMIGAKPVGNLWLGLKAGDPHHELSRRALAKAERLGMKLV